MPLLFNYFANSCWQIPLLTFCTWCALRIARPSIRTQYALWIATLLLAIALPLRAAAPQPQATITVGLADPAYVPFTHPVPIARPFFRAIAIQPRTRDLIAACYLSLTALCLLRLVASSLAVRRLLAASRPHRAPSLFPYPIRILSSAHVAPFVAGIVHPVILLPASLAQAPPEELGAILAHELAHIHRRDVLTNLLLRIVALPIAYHPATLLLHRHIRHAREMLCDARAAATLPSPNAYASTLLTLATHLIRPGARTPRTTVGLFERTSRPLLEERIMTLIAPPSKPPLATRILRVTAATLLLGAATAATTLLHLTPSVLAAQQTPPVAPKPIAIDIAPPIKPTASPEPLQTSNTVPSANQTTPFALQPVATSPAAARQDLTPEQRKEIEARLHATTDQILRATASLRDPAFQKQLGELAASQSNSPAFQKSMADLKAQLQDPAFKEQIRTATTSALNAANALRAANETAAQQKMLDDLKERLASPEFQQQIRSATSKAIQQAQTALSQADLQKRLAEAQQSLAAAAAAAAAPMQPGAQQPGRVRVSGGVMAGQILTKVAPVYPADAKAARISGTVVLHAIIGKDGAISDLAVVSGPRELQQSALDAVNQWTYKPYLLNGEPTEVDTTITVNYSFSE